MDQTREGERMKGKLLGEIPEVVQGRRRQINAGICLNVEADYCAEDCMDLLHHLNTSIFISFNTL
jgi:hypothetical protein